MQMIHGKKGTFQKRKRKADSLLTDGAKKKKKRAKTKGKMADFCDCISNFIQFE